MLPPHAWYAIVAVAALAAVGIGCLGVGPWWLGLLMAAPGAVAAAPAAIWMRARRSGGQPIVFIARFADENPDHSSIAAVHLSQFERRLRRNELLMSSFDIRYIKAPLKEGHARRLIEWTASPAVISGSGLLVDAHVRWEGWMLLRWPQMTGMLDRDQTGRAVLDSFRSRLSVVEKSATSPDREFPTRKMTADVFSAEHAQSVEGVLLVLASASALDEAAEREALAQADAMRDSLPVQAHAVLEIGKAVQTRQETGDILKAARQLEAAGDAGVDHIYLWNSSAALWTLAEQEDLSTGADRVRVSEKALRIAPHDFFAQAAAGYGYMAIEQPADAVPHLENAVRNEEVMDQQLLRQDLALAYWQSGQKEEAREQQRRTYHEWPPSMRRAILKANRTTEAEYLRDPCAGWDDQRGTATDLTDAEMDVVVRAVRAVVEHDENELRAMSAYDAEADPYVWTRAGPINLKMPPKPPREWAVSLSRKPDGRCAVDVWMWTIEDEELAAALGEEQEESPLALQLELRPAEDGTTSAAFVALQPL
jgi:tetratricopeptide (TPR) repeat protein